jgi:hypothetical protein
VVLDALETEAVAKAEREAIGTQSSRGGKSRRH